MPVPLFDRWERPRKAIALASLSARACMHARRDEGAFSVIAFVVVASLMVGPMGASLVVPATAYVWVSGFGSQVSAPAASMSLTSAGAMTDGVKHYTVASASTGLRYADVLFTVNGATLRFASSCEPMEGHVAVCSAATPVAEGDVVSAGHTLGFAGVAPGDTLRLLDARANSVMFSLTMG